MAKVNEFLDLADAHGSTVKYFRADSMIPCPCRTPEGFRDPAWHKVIEDLAVPPGPVVVNDNGIGTITGTVRYATAYRYVIPEGTFHKLRSETMGLVLVARQTQVIIPEFHVATVSATGVTHLVLFRSINNGVWNQIGIWTDLTLPVIDNNPTGFVNATLIPTPPICNEAAMLPDPAATQNVMVKAFVQPIQSTRATRLNNEILLQMFGDIESDDHLGIFPYQWGGTVLNFYDWGGSGEDFIEYRNRKYTVVNANLIPDPEDGDVPNHWEVGLRLINEEPLVV